MDISVHFIGKIVIILIMWKKREKDKIGKDKTFIVGGLSRYRLWYFFARLGNKLNKHTFVRTKGKYKGKFTVHCDFSSAYYGKEICDYFKSKSKIDFLKLELKERTKEFDNFWKEKKYKSEFVEKEVEIIKDKKELLDKNFDYYKIPKNLSQRDVTIQMKKLFESKKDFWSKITKSSARIQLIGQVHQLSLYKYFNVFKLKETTSLSSEDIGVKLGLGIGEVKANRLHLQGGENTKRTVLKYYERVKNTIINTNLGFFFTYKNFDEISDIKINFNPKTRIVKLDREIE